MKSKREIEIEKCLEKTLKNLKSALKYGESSWERVNRMDIVSTHAKYTEATKRCINRIQRVLKGVAK